MLVAKLTLGALAMGDQWFGGMTRNPWNPERGLQRLVGRVGRRAVAAGLVGFAIGSETLGSIVSPCTRCGATGLRPTFGRVSRARLHDALPGAWTSSARSPARSRTAPWCSARSTAPTAWTWPPSTGRSTGPARGP